METKIQEIKGFVDAISTICEKIDCFDDVEEVYEYLKAKFEDLLELEKSVDTTIAETKKAHEQELKGKIKSHVDKYKEKKKPTPPAKP